MVARADAKHHQIILHRWAKKKFDQHRDALEKHKEKGPAFRLAVEHLERTFDEN